MTTPRYLRANSAKGLERAMLQNNIKRKTWHQYQIVHDGKEWYAWFYVDLSGAYNTELSEVQKDAV
jgi:hypothetical protein